MWLDGQTDMTKLIVPFRISAKAPNNYKITAEFQRIYETSDGTTEINKKS
jgi:hypothetical protein